MGLRETIEQKKEMFDKISEPLSNAISQLEAWRKEWLEEKKRWNQWQSSLLDKELLDQVKSTFSKANGTIDTALNLVLPQLEAMLRVQARAGNIQAKLDVLVAKLDGLILLKRYGVLLEKLPPMFSSRYFSQFGRELWYSVLKGLDEILWPGSWFFDRLGWILLLQGFISLFTTIAIYRKRQMLNDYKHWRFLAARPFSAGFFLGIMTTLGIYAYIGVPATWMLAITIVGGISFARLSGGLIEAAWKRQFVYGLMFIIIVTKIMDVVTLPLA